MHHVVRWLRKITRRDRHDVSDAVNSLENIRKEFDEHLSSINENTNEIQTSYEYLSDLDVKMNKLHERIEQISLLLNVHQNTKDEYITLPLTEAEQEVFLHLYAMTESGPVSVSLLARKCGQTLTTMVGFLNNILRKGVPVVQHRSPEDLKVSLDDVFRQTQARKNVVGINENVATRIVIRG
ncbi:MAG: hypothetical protein ABIC95_03555 [archaeon]